MAKLGVILGGLFVLLTMQAHADIIFTKDGGITEAKIVEKGKFKLENGKQREYIVVELEDKSRKDIPVDQITGVAPGETSWEIRAKNKDWYTKEAPKSKDTWQGQYDFGKQCDRRPGLEDEAKTHFKKAYALRKAEVKDTIEEHEKIARWLESKEIRLYDEARDEYTWVYNEKKKTVTNKDGHLKLAEWCLRSQLFDEAEAEYNAVLQEDAANPTAKRGIEKIKQIREVQVDPQMYRAVKEQLAKAAAYVRGQQAADGTFGEDVTSAGVHGLRAMTALGANTMLIAWEFDSVENIEKSKEIPKELEKGLQWLIGPDKPGTGLRGKDTWGPILTLDFLNRVVRKRQFEKYKDKIKAKMTEVVRTLAGQQLQDGGWLYYDMFNTGASFVTAAAVINLVLAKKEGIPVDDGMLNRAVALIKTLKKGEALFFYRSGTQEQPEGAAARSSGCEMALLFGGGGSKGSVETCVNSFFKYRHILVAIKGQSGTHIGQGHTAPYYFLWGHMWTTRAIRTIDKSNQGKYLTQMRTLLLHDQEGDGSWVDWTGTPKHKVYGAALGAMALYHMSIEDKQLAQLFK